jgi:long-chain acyl-CoA synthetase
MKIAEDGEILSRGPHIMQGYFNKPSDTAEAIDPDGWFHTGDIGEVDEEGFLTITDRKKNILVLSNGKNVAPQPIENQLKQSPYISEIMLLGDQRSTVSALIVPSFDELKEFAAEQQLEAEDIPALLQTQEVQRLIRSEINQYSADFADFERVRRFTLVAEEFSEKSGEMTPTLKLKRSVVMENHKAAIDQMYGDDG